MIRRIIATLALGALLAVPFASSATASHVDPEFGYGNPSCSGTKIDPVNAGKYWLEGGGYVKITLTGGNTFSFNTEGSATVSAVTVKGGPNHNDYIYSPSVTSDSGLHAPTNPNNDKYYGLSHLCFESAKKDHKK